MTDTIKPEKIYAIFAKYGPHTNMRKFSLEPFEGACEYEIAKPLADYPEDELQAGIKSLQAEIDRRKAQDDEITILARKVCADNNNPYHLQADFIEGNRDKTKDMRLAKAAIIAGMELQRGNNT